MAPGGGRGWARLLCALVSLTPVLGAAPATAEEVGRTPVTFSTLVPCSALCPNTAFEAEDACVPAPPALPGSWDEVVVQVPVSIGGQVPTHLVFRLRPALDYDAFVCRVVPDSSGRYLAGDATNFLPCPLLIFFGCVEEAVVGVLPGEYYRLRAYNWSDLPSCPGEFAFIV